MDRNHYDKLSGEQKLADLWEAIADRIRNNPDNKVF